MLLNYPWVLCLAQNLKHVIISKKVETREFASLLL